MDFDFAAIQAFLDKFSLLGMPALVVVFALVALAKLLGLPSRWAPIAAVVAGMLVSGAIYLIDLRPAAEPVVRFVTLGLMLGLATIGGHAGIKAVFGRFQQVPPGTVIKTPSGQTDTTPTNSFTEGKRGPKPKGTV
jgi:hypothetical protein